MLLDIYNTFPDGDIYYRDLYTINLPQEITDAVETWFDRQEDVDFVKFRFEYNTKMPKQIFVFNLTNRKIYRYKFYHMFADETYGEPCDFTYCYQRYDEYTLIGDLTLEYDWVFRGLDNIYLKYAEIMKLLKNYRKTRVFFE